MSDQPSPPAAPTPAANHPTGSAESRLQQPMSLQNALIMSVVTALLGGGAAGSGVSLFGSDLRDEIREVRHEVTGLNDKLDEIYKIVDRAHPRNIGRPAE